MKRKLGSRARKNRKRPRILTTEKEVLYYLRKLKPRYRIRIGLKGKGNPFMYRVGKDIPGNTMRVRESLFDKLERKGLVEMFRKVNNERYAFLEYRIGFPKKRRRR